MMKSNLYIHRNLFLYLVIEKCYSDVYLHKQKNSTIYYKVAKKIEQIPHSQAGTISSDRKDSIFNRRQLRKFVGQ